MAAKRLIVAVLVIFFLTGAQLRAAVEDQALLLAVIVNRYDTGKIGEFVLREDALLARRQELEDLGFRVPDDVKETSDGLVDVSSLPGIKWRLDKGAQTLTVTAGANSLLPALLELSSSSGSAGPLDSGTGITLNYDVTGTTLTQQNVVNGTIDFRAFSPWGVVSSNVLGRFDVGPNGLASHSAIRLDSTYTFSDPEGLLRYRLGDFINAGLTWSRPVRIGGIQISSDFSQRPDLTSFPLPSLSGSVAAPSTVDVLVNGAALLSRQVQPGPFQIPQLPIVTGAGTIAMTVTDALGKQVTTNLPFYGTTNLLAAGLSTFSAEVGPVRRSWGTVSNSYGDLAASATGRYGFRPWLTVSGHAEGTAGAMMAGGGVEVNVDDLAIAYADAAISRGGGHLSHLFAAGVQRTGGIFSFGATAQIAGQSFLDIAATQGDSVPSLQLTGNASLSLGRFGGLGVAYTSIDRAKKSAPINLFVTPGSIYTDVADGAAESDGVVTIVPEQHSHILSASYSVQYGKLSFYLTGYHDFAGDHSSGATFGVAIPFGVSSSANASIGSTSGNSFAQFQAAKPAVSPGDWGYQAYATAARPSHEFGELQYLAPFATLGAGLDRSGHHTTGQGEAQGALSYLDGRVFASNRITDSFAVVDTAGNAGVHVLQENRDVGVTDSAGKMLVPSLRSFQINQLGIDPSDIPTDSTVTFTSRIVRPQDRSGVVVRFPIHAGHSASLVLVDKKGHFIPVGSVATLVATRIAVPVGYDGQVYVEDLVRDNVLNVETADGQRCTARFTFVAVKGDIPNLGTVTCQERKP